MSRATVTAPSVDHDPTDPAFHADPYPTWAAMRALGPVVRWDAADAFLVVGHEAARVALGDTGHFSPSRRFAAGAVEPEGPPTGVIERIEAAGLFHVGPADHLRLRRLVSRAFTPASVEALRPRVRARVDAHLDALAATAAAAPDGVVDLAPTARALPVEVIADYLGLDDDAARWFGERARPVVDLTDPFLTDERRAEVAVVLGELEAFVDAAADERRRSPRDDLLGRLVATSEEGDRLSHDELVSLVVALLLAGAETTSNLITLGTHALCTHPDALALLRRRPELTAGAVEELLRWSYIGTAIARYAITDAVLPAGPGGDPAGPGGDPGGVAVPAGSLVIVAVGAALWDPAVVHRPEVLDLERTGGHTLAFGIGPHHCLGAALARLEAQEAIGGLLARFDGLAAGGPPTFDDHLFLRGLQALPLRLGP